MDLLKDILGIGTDPKDLSLVHVSARGVLVFLYCIFLVRIADKRFLSRKSAFDAVLGFVLASMMARAINGSAAFGSTLVGGLVLVLLHRLLAHLAMSSHRIGGLLKGCSDVVIEDGVINRHNLRRNDFSDNDLLEDLRLSGVTSPAEVRLAHIERNGKISVVRK